MRGDCSTAFRGAGERLLEGIGAVVVCIQFNTELQVSCIFAGVCTQVVAQAGLPSSVTIATNMAGRGTDIILGGNPEGLTRMGLKRYILRSVTEAQPWTLV
jgi:hypothetical protein